MTPGEPLHDERLVPAAPWSAATLAVAVLVAADLATGAGGVRAVLGVAVLVAAVAGLAALSRRRVRVVAGRLEVPGARVGVEALGAAAPLDRAATARARGRGRVPGAFAPAAPGVATAVQVEVTDPQDPTPLWVVPTRRPGDLVAALGRARGTGPPRPGPGARPAPGGHRSEGHRPEEQRPPV